MSRTLDELLQLPAESIERRSIKRVAGWRRQLQRITLSYGILTTRVAEEPYNETTAQVCCFTIMERRH